MIQDFGRNTYGEIVRGRRPSTGHRAIGSLQLLSLSDGENTKQGEGELEDEVEVQDELGVDHDCV